MRGRRYLIHGRLGEPPGFKDRVFLFAVPVIFVIVLAGFMGGYLSVLPSAEWRSTARGIWLAVNVLASWAFFMKLYRTGETGAWRQAAMTGILVVAFGAISWNGLLLTVPWLMAKSGSGKIQLLAVMQERLMYIRGRCARRISVLCSVSSDRFDICLDDEPMPAVGERLILESRRTWFGLVVDRVSMGP